MWQSLSFLKTNEQRCLLLGSLSVHGHKVCRQKKQLPTTAPSFMQTHFLLLSGHVQPEISSHHSVWEGKAVPTEPIGVELEEGMIKTWEKKLCLQGIPSKDSGGTSAHEPCSSSSLSWTSGDSGRISSSAIFRQHLRLSPAMDATRHGAKKSAAWQLLYMDSRNIFGISCTICLSQVFIWEDGGGEGHLRAPESNKKCFIGQYTL